MGRKCLFECVSEGREGAEKRFGGLTIWERLGVEEDANVDKVPPRRGEDDGRGGFGGGVREPADGAPDGDVGHVFESGARMRVGCSVKIWLLERVVTLRLG